MLENRAVKISLIITGILILVWGVLKVGDYFNETNCRTSRFVDVEREQKVCKSISLMRYFTKNKKNLIGNVIKEEIDNEFSNKDYIVEIKNEDNTKMYYYSYMIAGVKTNIGYTVYMDSKEKLVKWVFNNMSEYDRKELISENKEFIKEKIENLTENKKEDIRDNALKQSDNLEIVKEYMSFYVESKKLYYVIELKDTIEYREEI